MLSPVVIQLGNQAQQTLCETREALQSSFTLRRATGT